MKLKRIERDGTVRVGALSPDDIWCDVTQYVGDLGGATLADGAPQLSVDWAACPPLGEGRLLPCVGNIGKLMCIGLNYSDHAAEMNMAIPTTRSCF